MALQTLDPIERLRRREQNQILDIDTTSGALASESANLQRRQAQMLAAIQRASQAEQPQEDTSGEIDFNGRKYNYDEMSTMPAEQSARIVESAEKQGSILPGWARVTQEFGKKNPGIEVFSKSGINHGTDFGIKEGTPLALPPGEWEVLEAYSGAKGRGFIGNKVNRGYGNSVLVRNADTGETMRFSHLSGVNVQPGKIYKGGTVLGASGATGNVTGPHLDLEYKTAAGKYQDVLRSQYSKNLFGQGGGSESYGMGGGVPSMLGDIKSKAEKAISDYVARNKEMTNRYGEQETASYNMASMPILPNVKWQELASLMERNKVPGRTIVSAFGEMQAKDPTYIAQQKMATGQPLTQQDRAIMNESGINMAGSMGGVARVSRSGLVFKMHPDDLRTLDKIADTLGESATKGSRERIQALKDLQVLADSYLPGDQKYGTTKSILNKLLKETNQSKK
jgi:murein DD-endopeptidase MepM/ murein hydrolase activator NlpD